jgi:hypothetical protein
LGANRKTARQLELSNRHEIERMQPIGRGLDEKGAIALREKLSRGRIAARLVNVPKCDLLGEACR